MSNNSKNKKPRMTKKDLQTAKRLMKYMTGKYKFQFILVFFCILISAVATTAVSLSLRYLLDDFILPLIGQKSPDFAGLYKALTVLGCVFLAGVAATFIYTRMMVYIGQGVLKRVRDDMFEHMQTLPIRYFDQNTNGSIMSLYTNDTDTLRQMISPGDPAGADGTVYDCRYLYFHAGSEPAAHDPGGFDHFPDAVCHRKDRCKEWKILRSTADVPRRCDRFCRRAYERTACCQSF